MELASFTAASRVWQFELNLLQVRRVQTATGGFLLPRVIDLASEEYQRLGTDSELLCVVLEVLLRDQLAAASLSLEQLLEQMSGEEVSHAVSALVGAVANFSRSRTAAATARLIQQGLQQMSQLDQQAGTLLEGLVPSGDWFGSLQASPVSNPGATHSETSPFTPTPPPGGSPSLPEVETLPPVRPREFDSTP